MVALKELSSCSVEGPLEGSAVQGASSFYRFIGGTHMHHRCSILNLIWIIKFLGNFTIFFSSHIDIFRRYHLIQISLLNSTKEYFVCIYFGCCIKETFSNIRIQRYLFDLPFIFHNKIISNKIANIFCGKAKLWTYYCKPLLPMMTNYQEVSLPKKSLLHFKLA